jgi:hypothetical protein
MADWTAKATVEGTKTETRRVVTRGTSTCEVRFEWLDFDDAVPDPAAWGAKGHGCLKTLAGNHPEEFLRDCRHRVYPRWFPGDLLYVRQAWAVRDRWNDTKPTDIEQPATVWYRADGEPRGLEWSMKGRWRPSIHMPKWATRTWLRVESVHCERLRDMTGIDVHNEGLSCPVHDFCTPDCPDFAREWVRQWDALNAKRGFGWDANCWVWVLRYSLTEAPD